MNNWSISVLRVLQQLMARRKAFARLALAPLLIAASSMAHAAITLSPSTLANATVGVAYLPTAITASGGTAPYTYQISGGALPAGMNLSSSGTLSGTPTSGGTFTFTVQATDSGAGTNTGLQSYTLTVNAPTIVVSPSSLPNATVGSAYSQTITASGGTALYTYAKTAGTLPTGISLSAGGVLSGTPTSGGTYNFTVTATDSSTGTGPYTGSIAYSLTVAAAPVANPVSASVAYDSGANPITLNFSGGTPTSVAVASAASHGTATASGTSITYTPTPGYAGSDSFTYTGTNSAGTSAPATVTITVSNPTLSITASSSLNTKVGQSYSQTFTFSGGAAPYSGYSILGIPAGLQVTAFDSTSITVSGTPTVSGTFQLTVQGTDSSTGNGPFTVKQNFTLNIASATMSISPSTLPGATVGTAYSQAFTTTGGISPYTYTVTSGALPAGMSLSASGILSGTPTASGNYNFTVTSTDASTGAGSPATTSTAYTLTVSSPTMTISPTTLPGATVNTAYSQTLTVSGGTAPYTFAVTTGALPAGMNLSSGGVLSGTPTTTGTYAFTVTATDSLGFTGTQSYSITVANTVVNRPDPTKDTDVTGLINMQLDTAQRFRTAQITNFQQRMESLHHLGQSTSPGKASLASTATATTSTVSAGQTNLPVALPSNGTVPGDAANSDTTWLVNSLMSLASTSSVNVNMGTLSRALFEQGGSSATANDHRLHVWGAGNLRFGTRNQPGGGNGIDFTTVGVTIGADMRYSDKLVLGAGLGFAHDNSSIGADGTGSKANGNSVAIYASYQPTTAVFVDGVVGYSTLDYDSTRYVAAANNVATASRSGSQTWGSLAAGYEYHVKTLLMSPYIRYNQGTDMLDTTTETGAGVSALYYAAQTSKSEQLTLGYRAEAQLKTHFGLATPRGRIEYQHASTGSSQTSLAYADTISSRYNLNAPGTDVNTWLFGIGSGLVTQGGWHFDAEYQYQYSAGEVNIRALSLRVSTQW